jgi:general secretion pathway protein I
MRTDLPRGAARDAGFTLLEVMVSFIIAALAITLLYNGATGGLNATETATKTEEALSLARSHLVAIGRGEGVSRQDTSGVDGDGFEWHLRIRSVASRPLALSDSDRANDTKPTSAVLYDILVTESWKQAGHPHALTLQTRRFETRAEGG